MMLYYDTVGNKQHMHLSLSTLSLLATTLLTFLCLPGETIFGLVSTHFHKICFLEQGQTPITWYMPIT